MLASMLRRAPLLLLLAGCGSSSGPAPATPVQDTVVVAPPPADTPVEAEPPIERLESAHRIDGPETWERLAARPDNLVIARTEVVKFLIDLESDRQLWFTDTERWTIHYHFARDRLGMPRGYEAHGDFNERQYRHPDRRFVMGSVVHYLDPDLWTFEMIAGDNLPGDRVARAFAQVRDALWVGEQLRYRPISELHEVLTENVAALPRVSAQEVFGGIRYQPLTRGTSYGTLRFVRGPLDLASVRPDQILVLEQLPDEIPVVSGVISQQLQAPLGHIAILCGTRGTPNMGLRDALSSERLAALEGQLVRLDVESQDFQVRVATRAEAEASWESRRPAQRMAPRLDSGDHGLPNICDLRYADAIRVGAKAAQLGHACAIDTGDPQNPIRTPGGFAIPFHHYLEHLSGAGIANGITGMLADQAFRADARVRERRLSELRAAIQRTSVDPALMRELRRRIRSFRGQPRVILRSSTNAEDLPGFTGAGLYRSVVISGRASDREIADALREVWASVWLQGAYEEREWYRIDHSAVAMGVIVQPFVDGATANGVALTANPFYQNRPGFFVNAQALGGSVTGAAGEEIPEQHLIYTYQGLEPELLSRSSRSPQPLMREPELLALAAALQQIHDTFVPIWESRQGQLPEGGTIAAEVEFLVAGPDHHVVILQARPYTVVYQEGQR